MKGDVSFPCDAVRPLPVRTEVVVIGGGIVGVSAALWLAERGTPVVLCEKGRMGGEQSSRNWGWIRKLRRNLLEMPLMLESQAIWRSLAPRLDRPIGLVEGGTTYLAPGEAELAAQETWHRDARPYQLDSEMLGRREANLVAGREDGPFVGGIRTASDLHAEPRLAVPAMARFAAAQGVEIFEATAVRCLELDGGSLRRVHTEHGPIACGTVILAGGAWCRPFLENMGRPLAQLAVRSQAQRTSTAPRFTAGPLGSPQASVRPRADGGYTVGRTRAARFDLIPAAFTHFHRYIPILRDRWRILKIRFGKEFFGALGRHRWGPDQMSPFEQARMMDPEPDLALLADTLRTAKALYPALGEVRPVEKWGGLIDVTPDELPAIGPVPGVPGLHLATGFSGHGFGLGPAGGRLAAELALGLQPCAEPEPFLPQRLMPATRPLST